MMNALWLLLIPLMDQACKFWVRRWLRDGPVSLGRLGSMRIVNAQIWWARGPTRPGLPLIWTGWLLSATALLLLTRHIPSSGWCASLLLGGSLSHLLETTFHGSVTDYVCLRFWPAFNLADVAITVGVIGLVLGVIEAIKA